MVAQPSRNRASGVIRSVTTAPLDQPFAQAALAAQPALEPCHPAVVVLVIIAKQMQQSMQREHPQFGLQAVAGLPGLPAAQRRGDHDVAEIARLVGGKRQDVGRLILLR